MPAQLPYLASPGLIPKILAKIQEARRPERFTHDFLETKLGHSGGSAKAIVPLLKRMGFINSDGSPSTLYDRFRNSETQGAAVAQGMRNAYSELFDRNQYAGDLTKEKLKALVMEVTGAAHDDRAVELTISTFIKLKDLADFDAKTATVSSQAETSSTLPAPPGNGQKLTPEARRAAEEAEGVGLNLAYTVNIVLPETTNPEVYSSIFRSLKENMLRKS